MKYSIGDNVLCKLSFKVDDNTHFIKGKYYDIHDYKILDVYHYYYVLTSELSNNSHIYKENMCKYFYTKTQLRKLKLDKLNGGR